MSHPPSPLQLQARYNAPTSATPTDANHPSYTAQPPMMLVMPDRPYRIVFPRSVFVSNAPCTDRLAHGVNRSRQQIRLLACAASLTPDLSPPAVDTTSRTGESISNNTNSGHPHQPKGPTP